MIHYSRRTILRTGSALGAGAITLSTPSIWSGAWAQTKKLDTINLAGSAGNLQLVIQYMAQHYGYLESFGLEANYSNILDGNRITSSLVSGDSDACMMSGFSQVPIAVERGAKLKLIAGSTLLLNQCLFAKKPEIKTVKDLEGKTIGVGSIGSLLHQLVLALFNKKGVDPSTVRFVNVGSNQDVFRAVVTGVMDAGPSTIDVYNRQAEFGVHSLTDGEYWKELPEYTQQGSYTADNIIASKRDLLVRTLAAYAKLYRYLSTPASKDTFIKARAAAFGGKSNDSDAVFQWNWLQQYKPFATNLVLSEERIDFIEDLNIEVKSQKARVPLAKLADMSLAKDAIKLVG